VEGLAITLGHCCSPIPGDDIVGYITKGKGITIHRANCPNIQAQHTRLIDVSWKEDLGISTYPVDIEIYANDRMNLVAEILQVFGAKGISVSDLHAHLIPETMNDVIALTVNVTDAKVLQDSFADLLGLKGVYEIRRITH
ncbi:MAG: bifunctional (p)ppGpp synthetase/guanosine-3',5'-bis(diphosphate) 3'-pyrophosphohydrolase, partial [Bacilli bacterium]|nr:bifunctional (p)ppGpp synthetase/guanosine-3',5'-bis(diphosphate) 3'-pyrophosphohydrolase [Bacilli bacterium]